jgi:hypothetical protein
VDRAGRGLIDADLGGGLIKQRVGRARQSRRGGYRTLMAFKAAARVVFVYGFAKSERDNIGADELQFWRRVASAFVAMSDDQLDALMKSQDLVVVNCSGKD